jgi:predicted RNA binding protein YcfA (HicA-like mRNA interferase family)
MKVRQKGSPVTLQRNGTFVTVPVKEMRVGLLARILKDCNILRDEFLDSL